MKGYFTNVKEGFKVGLRPYNEITRNTGVLVEGMNCLAGKLNLKGYSPDVEKFPAIYNSSTGVEIDFSVKWPFPQVFQTDTGIYIGNQKGLYLIEYDAVYGLKGTLLTSTYTGADLTWPWTFANCPGYPMFSSGDMLVYYDTDAAAWNWWTFSAGTAGNVWNSAWYPPVSVAFNRGQFVAAGSKTHTTYPSQSRQYRWSAIGDPYFLNTPSTHNDLLKVISNTAGFGFEPADDYGILMRVVPLNKGFIVYGTFGITALIPVTEPSPTFSPLPVLPIGIANPLAVGGSLRGDAIDKHLFVDRVGVLWELSWQNSPVPKRLGFQEYLAPMQDGLSVADGVGLISLTYNPYEDEYYISNGETAYVYNGVGMTPVDKCITSMVDYKNAQVTSGFHYTVLSDAVYGYYNKVFSGYDLLVKTDVFDMNVQAAKTVESVLLGMNVPEGGVVECMVEWRNDKSKMFKPTPWKRVSPDGFCVPMVTAVEFRICLKCSKWEGFELSSMTVGWKLVDKNRIRGAYAGDITAGAGA